MKIKQTLALLCSLLFIVTASGCSAKKAVQIDVDALANKLMSSVKFNDQLTKLDEKAALKLYGLQSSDVTKQSVFVGTGATAEEISVWQAKNADAAKRVKDAVLARIEAQKVGFQDYVPKEMTKLKNPMLVTEGNTVILCLSNQNTTAKQVIDSLIK